MTEPHSSNDPYRDIHIVVIGASGFIGRWVARDLAARGARLSLVVRDRLAAEQIFWAYGVHGNVFEADLENLETVTKLLETLKPCMVFNLAGYGMDRSGRDNKSAYQINARLVRVILNSMAKVRNPLWMGQDIVHVGTALEYGIIGGNLCEDSIPHPTTLYGASKLAGTELLKSFCSPYKVKAVTARPFTVYGPGERPGRLLPSLLKSAETRSPLKLTQGEQMRDFIYVEDVAEGLLRLGVCLPVYGDIVNLATGKLTSVRSFAETAAKIIGIPQHNLLFGEIPPIAEEMHHTEVTTERLQQLTSWLPATGIVEGIRKTTDGVAVFSTRATRAGYSTQN